MASLNEYNTSIEDTNLPSKIINGVHLGTVNHAWDEQILQKLKITHIVCCISGAISKSNDNIKRLIIPMDDRGYSVLKEKIEKAFSFITKAIKNNQNVLIHCKSSVNRSPTITVAFLMYHKQMTLKEAHGIVSKQHALICCHHNYMDQLRECDMNLHGSYSTKPDELETTKSMMAKLRQQFAKQNSENDIEADSKNNSDELEKNENSD